MTGSSIGKKIVMALSGLFLVSFLLLHFAVNFVSVFSPDAYNAASEFMGTNFLVQFVMQPILVIGVIVHFVMGMYLEVQNRSARKVKYAKYKGNANSSWMSRNMIYSGLVVLLFLAVHFVDFWFPEMQYKYIDKLSDAQRYYPELVEEFHNPVRVGVYVLAFIALILHLLHGFQSSFQSVGLSHKRYTPVLKTLGVLFAYIVPIGFIFIALFHHFSH
ncbi:MAG: succinate dehydrogenase cytochrome b subunit [Bacteroidia bacterium]